MAEEKPRIWISDTLTLEYPEGVVGLIRCLSNPLESPGPTEWACAIVIDSKGECKIKILNGTRGPTLKETKQLIKYFSGLGYTGGWNRYKKDKNPKIVVIKQGAKYRTSGKNHQTGGN